MHCSKGLWQLQLACCLPWARAWTETGAGAWAGRGLGPGLGCGLELGLRLGHELGRGLGRGLGDPLPATAAGSGREGFGREGWKLMRVYFYLLVSRGFLFAWILVSFACPLVFTQEAPEGKSLLFVQGEQRRPEGGLSSRVEDTHASTWISVP